MNNRTVKINVKDILFDYRIASAVINNACSRSGRRMSVKGCFKLDDNLFVCLEPSGLEHEKPLPSYIISPIEGMGEDAVLGEINSRLAYGFSTIACFEIDDKMWGLFESGGAIESEK